nr:MlaD family protein [Fundidesulfovibrio soli]
MIGLFVLGALVLAVLAVAAFGSGMFLTKKHKFVLYFDNSVSGLSIGSPVVFRGVPVGTVTGIGVQADAGTLRFTIPVHIELESGKISFRSAPKNATLLSVTGENISQLLQRLIEIGLRAQLVTQSFVTGQLAVSLDFMPESPANLKGKEGEPEIPTVPSAFEQFSNTLRSLPLTELVDKLMAAVAGVERLVNSPQTGMIPASINTALDQATKMMNDLQARIDPLAKSMEDAVKNYATLAQNLDRRSDNLSNAADKTIENFNATLKEARAATVSIQRVVNQDSPTVTDLNKALTEIAAAAKSIRALADTLERHPEALLQGKGGPRR